MIARRIEQLEAVDGLADVLQAGAAKVVPPDSPLKRFLNGPWLGHPLHPALTDLVIGSWTGAWLLEVVGGRESRRAADTLLEVGTLASLPTALSGVADWSDLEGETRRVGAVHAVGNTAALLLQVCSLAARKKEHRSAGLALSTAAVLLSTGAGWLGGHLSYGLGVGVDQTVFEDPPTAWTSLIDEGKLEEGELVRRSARGTGVLLVRRHGNLHALLDRCSHLGCSLSAGALEGDELVCSCHGSRFKLDGRLVRGPATSPQPALEVRVQDGKIEVRASDKA